MVWSGCRWPPVDQKVELPSQQFADRNTMVEPCGKLAPHRVNIIDPAMVRLASPTCRKVSRCRSCVVKSGCQRDEVATCRPTWACWARVYAMVRKSHG